MDSTFIDINTIQNYIDSKVRTYNSYSYWKEDIKSDILVSAIENKISSLYEIDIIIKEIFKKYKFISIEKSNSFDNNEIIHRASKGSPYSNYSIKTHPGIRHSATIVSMRARQLSYDYISSALMLNRNYVMQVFGFCKNLGVVDSKELLAAIKYSEENKKLFLSGKLGAGMNAIFNKEDILDIFNLRANNKSYKFIINKYDIKSTSHVSQILNRKIYKDIAIPDNIIKEVKKNNKRSSWIIRGKKHQRTKAILIEDQVTQIINLLRNTNISFTEIGKKFGVTNNAISAINAGRTWKYLTVNENISLNNRIRSSVI